MGVRELADGALEHGLALGGGLPPVPQSTRNPDLTSDVTEGVLEVGHQDGCDGAAQRQRPGRQRLPPRRHPARSSCEDVKKTLQAKQKVHGVFLYKLLEYLFTM